MRIPKKVLRAINLLVKYSFINEEKHFEESGKPKNHIFRDVRKINHWLKNTIKQQKI